MVDLNTNRIAHTNVGQNGPDLGKIAETLASAEGTSQVRAKSDGMGGTVVYGHKKSFFSFFNRANPQREAEGTKLIFKAIDTYVAGKSPQTQQLAKSLLGNYYNDRQKTWTGTISSQQVIDIKQKLDEMETLAKHKNFGDRFSNGQDLTQVFSNNLSLCSSILGHGSTPEHEGLLAQIPVPEMGVGMMIAVLDGLDGRERHQGLGNDVLQPFATPGEVDFLERQQSIANAFKQGRQLDDVLKQYCDLARDRFVSTETFEDWSTKYNEDHGNEPNFKPITTPNDIRAPIFLTDPDAVEAMESFDKASGREKLEILKDVFDKHMNAGQDYTVSRQTVQGLDLVGFMNRTGNTTPNEAMSKGINWFADAVFKVA